MLCLKGKAPWIEIDTALFADNWKRMLENPQHADVTFIVEGKHHLQAHKVMLCAASRFFHKVLGVTESVKVITSYQHISTPFNYFQYNLVLGCP